jgi:hypothetical protein
MSQPVGVIYGGGIVTYLSPVNFKCWIFLSLGEQLSFHRQTLGMERFRE